MIDFFKIHKNKLNIILSILFIVPIFFEIKLFYKISFFYLKTSYLFLVLIFLIYILNFKFLSKKNIFFFYLGLFLFANFILNYNQIDLGLFLKQLIAIFFFIFIFFNLYNSNLINLDFFLKLYLTLSLISAYVGLLVLLFYLIFQLDVSFFLSLKNLSITLSGYFFENTKFLRFNGFSSEPATLGIALLPAILILLNNPNRNKIHLYLMIVTVLATQSIYPYLGLILILLNIFRKQKFLLIFLLLLIIILGFQVKSIRSKIIDTSLYSKSIFNKGWDQKNFERDIFLILKGHNYKTLEQYAKLYLTGDEHAIKIDVLNKIFENNRSKMNSQIKKSDIQIILKNDIFITYSNFNASSCAYFYNAFITLHSLNQNLLTGVGLGNYFVAYNQFSDKWKFKRSNYLSCYLLNSKDAKTIFFRSLAEFGIFFYFIFIIFIIYFYFKTFFLKYNISHCFYLCFLLKILQLGSYTDFAAYLFLTIAIKLYNSQKENVRTS
jgi:hypothetical protein